MYTVKHGGDIHKGDLIAVANGSYMSIGIYFGRGQGGTVQYYGTGTPGYCKKRYEERLKIGEFYTIKVKTHMLRSVVGEVVC